MGRTLLTGLAGLALLSPLSACGAVKSTAAPVAGSSTVNLVSGGTRGTTRFLAHNLLYRLDPNIAMYLTEMNADVVLKDPTLPFVPANKTDYSLNIHRAVVEKDASSLEALMNNYVFNDSDSPLRNLHLSYNGDLMDMQGEMKKLGVWVPFEMQGTLAPTEDGMISMTPTLIKSAGLRVDGLFSLIGIQVQTLMKTKESKGVLIRGNQIVMDPARLYPPPVLHGKVSAVSIKAGRLHIEFDDGKAQPWPNLPVPNPTACLCMWGGDVLIDESLNINSRMELLDSTPATPMVFALDRYREQLEAGFVVPTREGDMLAYVPDILNYTADLGRYAPAGYPIPGINLTAPDQGLVNAERLPFPMASSPISGNSGSTP